MLAGRIGGLRCGVRFLIWQWLRVEMPVISYHAPFPWKGMPEGQGGVRRRKRAKPTSGATRHCTCQQKLDTKLKKLGIKIEYLYKIQ